METGCFLKTQSAMIENTTEKDLAADYTDYADFSMKINKKGRIDFF